MDTKTGLLIAGAAGAAALLLGKKKSTAACPPGSQLDQASGQCIYIRTVEVEKTGGAGDQKNKGGTSETAEMTYDYNLQMLNLWQVKAEQYGDDVAIQTEYKALMNLINASSMIGDDTPAGKAKVDRIDKMIQDSFANLDFLRADKAASLVREAQKATRLELAVDYHSAAQSANIAFTEAANDLFETFTRAINVVNYYRNKQSVVTQRMTDVYVQYAKVANVMHDLSTLPSELPGKLPSSDHFGYLANILAGINPPASDIKPVLDGAPLVLAQLAALKEDFKWYNVWGLYEAKLQDAANPIAAAGKVYEGQVNLERGMGSLYCGRAVAVLSVLPVLAALENYLNDLEVALRIYQIGLSAVHKAIDHAAGVERSILGGDGAMSSNWMSQLMRTMNYPGGGIYCPMGNCNAQQNRSQDFIKGETRDWLVNIAYQLPLAIPPDLLDRPNGLEMGSVVTPQTLFTQAVAGLPSQADVLARLSELYEQLRVWSDATNILSGRSAAPDAGEFRGKFDLTLVGPCGGSASVEYKPEPDYQTMTAGPEQSKIVHAPTEETAAADAAAESVKLTALAQSLEIAVGASFNGLRGLRGLRGLGVAVSEGGGRGALRVSIAERVVARSGLGRLGGSSSGSGLGRAGLGDPIQQILSPLCGLGGRKRR